MQKIRGCSWKNLVKFFYSGNVKPLLQCHYRNVLYCKVFYLLGKNVSPRKFIDRNVYGEYESCQNGYGYKTGRPINARNLRLATWMEGGRSVCGELHSTNVWVTYPLIYRHEISLSVISRRSELITKQRMCWVTIFDNTDLLRIFELIARELIKN